MIKRECNKARFEGKEIKTLVFALNIDEIFEIIWHPEQDYKKDVILRVIKDYLYNELKIKTNNFYNIYNYYKNNNKLNDLINDFKKENDNSLPSFIELFFRSIQIAEEIIEIPKERFNLVLDETIKKIIDSYN